MPCLTGGSVITLSSIMDVVIVIPVFNQAPYTKLCLDSLRKAGLADSQIVVVDNASTDETVSLLAARPELKVIRNDTNRGCGCAWNQGAKAVREAPWVLLLNNDVVAVAGWLEGLLETARTEKFDIVSPALRNGKLDYDLEQHVAGVLPRMSRLRRPGLAHGVCFLVNRGVFEAIGAFNEDPLLGGYEDDEFFRRARRAGFRLCITGRSFLHHFGSVTQKSLKGALNVNCLGDRDYYRRLTGQTWLRRKTGKLKESLFITWCRLRERLICGHTLVESPP
jgi:N-acetylglucosaminyl-diphospho-decaprenol L-rhamnosyltransferase